jgi:DNA end-binding protein Ku
MSHESRAKKTRDEAAHRSSPRQGRKGEGDPAEPAGTDGASSPRALWTGTLGFGLIQIPVRLLGVESTKELAFHELDRRDSARIGYERINKSTGKPVEWKDVVKGYEIEKGRFVVLDPEDFKNASVEATQSIEIQDFVRAGDIPLSFFERPYSVVPEKRGEKAYAVLRDALASKGYVGVALVVLRTRQHLCAITVEGQGLVVELLRFAHELRPALQPRDAPEAASRKDVALAENLIEAMVGPWEPAKYRDTYAEDLLAAIRRKDETGHVEAVKAPAKREAAVTDLAELLRRSVLTLKKGGAVAKKRKAAA